MQKKSKKYFIITGVFSLLFVLFTVMVKTIDVKPIGPEESTVGFAAINRFVFELFGVNLIWYHITDWLGLVAIAIAFGFTVLGLFQLIKRKSILKVDCRILLLGAFYCIVIAFYIFFEFVAINYRPVILSQSLAASYPSSHVMIGVSIMVTAMLQFHHYLREKKKWLLATDIVSILVIAVTVIGRLISGVHWFTDIVAGILLSSSLIALYCAALEYFEEKRSDGQPQE